MTTPHTPDHASTPLSHDMETRLKTLTGFLAGSQAGFGLDLVLDGVRIMALATKDRTEAATLLTVIAGEQHGQDDLIGLIADLILHLTNPNRTPALTELPADAQATIRHRGEQWAAHDTTLPPRDLIAETAALITDQP